MKKKKKSSPLIFNNLYGNWRNFGDNICCLQVIIFSSVCPAVTEPCWIVLEGSAHFLETVQIQAIWHHQELVGLFPGWALMCKQQDDNSLHPFCDQIKSSQRASFMALAKTPSRILAQFLCQLWKTQGSHMWLWARRLRPTAAFPTDISSS